ncbi:MAG: transglutaminase-like domain-containing protein [Syntrophobacterales bacterium]|nr:transglutaminase-like domain-containing protein [Syntrophobacterales bacterium]
MISFSNTRRSILRIAFTFLLFMTLVEIGKASEAPSFPAFIEDKKNNIINEATKAFSQSAPELAGVRFLVQYLSIGDLIRLTSEEIINHVRYSYKARELMPWGKSIPEKVFLEYVLFHRAAQEPFEPYKPKLFSKLAPVAYQAKNMSEAALAVNRWVFEQVSFRPSSAWDMGPLGLLRRGFGRCEELAILVVSALRSVAIPARIAWIPAWRHTEGNHAWVEVYLDDGKWHFLDAASLQDDFDRPWFKKFLTYAPIVWTTSLEGKNCSEGIAYGKIFLCNERERYIKTKPFIISVVDSLKGLPLKASLRLLVWNGGRLRSIIDSKTDEKGVAQFNVSPGGCVLEVVAEEPDGGFLQKLFCLKDVEGMITVSFDGVFSDSFRCNLYLPELPANSESGLFPSSDVTRSEKLVTSIGQLISLWRDDMDWKISSHLAEAGSRAFELLVAMEDFTNEELSATRDILFLTDPKGLALTFFHDLRHHVRKLLGIRRERIKMGLSYDDEVFTHFVLSPQFPDEPPFWFSEKIKFLSEKEDLTKLIERALEIAKTVAPISQEFFSSPLHPEDVILNRISYSRRETLIALGVFMRFHGVATFYDELNDRLIIHDGRNWQVFNHKADSIKEALTPLEPPGELVIEYGDCQGPTRPSYGVDFAITKLDAGKRIFVKNPKMRWDNRDCSFRVTLPEGVYEFSAGRRISPAKYPMEIEFFLEWPLIKSGEQTKVRYPELK